MNLKELTKNPNIKKYFAIVIILALFVFVGGRMSGYLIAQDTYNTELANLTEKYGALNASYNSCLSDVSGKNSTISSLEAEKSALTSNLSMANINLGNCNTELSGSKASVSSLTQQKDSLNQSYNAVVANSAKSLCCVKKIFDPSLNAYYIENNTIICTKDTSKTLFAC